MRKLKPLKNLYANANNRELHANSRKFHSRLLTFDSRKLALKYFFNTLLSLILLIIAGTAVCFAQDKIVAVVNNEIITRVDLEEFMNFTKMQSQTEVNTTDLLERLIEDRLILQEAKKNKLNVDENRVKAKIEEIRKRYPAGGFQEALQRQGLTQADMETKIREQILMRGIINMKINSKISVSPTEVTDYFQQNIAVFNIPEKRKASYLATEDQAQLDEIYAALKVNDDLNAQAQKYGMTPGEIEAGKGEELKVEIQNVIFGLKLGEFSTPINIENKYYIFKITGITPEKKRTLLDVREQISKYLYNEKMQSMLTQWIDDLRKRSYIKISGDEETAPPAN